MKRLLLLLALCLTLAMPVMAAPLTFQNEHDLTDVQTVSYIGTCNAAGLTRSTTAGNQYMYATTAICGFQNAVANPFTYAAWTDTNVVSNGARVRLSDASNVSMYELTFSGSPTGIVRLEVVVTGSTARIYKNGILVGTSGALATNPSYVQYFTNSGGIDAIVMDDFIMNTAEGKYVVGMPTTNGYFLKKDMINPSNSGVFNYSTGALVDSNYMYTTWGRGNTTEGENINESMYLQNVNTGVTYETHYTGNLTAGTTQWNVASSLVATSAPYGLYRVRFGTFDSEEIAYIANGANVDFDKSNYNQNDVATITYLIDAPYWDTSTYTYALKVYRVNDWVVVSTTPITSTTGTVLYQFTSSDTQGTYYAVITATPNAGGDEIRMAFNWAQMTAYFAPYGYVNNESGSVISGANVSLSQGSIISNTITTASGNYTGSGFLTGAVMTINVTATGYSQYLATLTPMVTGSKYINITLNSTSPACTGLCIGGVHRDGILTGTLITSGYGRPIPGATAHAKNTTYGDYCTNVSNNAGWYIFDESNGCVLTSGRPYDVWSTALGYSNSPNYTVVA